MMRAFFLLTLLVAFTLMLGCGEDASGPPDGPTPSTLSVEFTGDTTAVAGEGVALSIGRDSQSGRSGLGPRATCQVTASWSICPDPDFASYTLFRSVNPGIAQNPSGAEVLGVINDVNQDGFVDDDVTWGTHYYYALRTANTGDELSWSNEVDIVTPGGPTPSVLEDSTTATTVVLWWTVCPNPDFSHYTLYRSDSPGIANDTLAAEKLCEYFDSGAVSFTDSMPALLSAYYALRTTNTFGFEVWSNEVNAILQDSCIIAWGGNSQGQCDVPSPNSSFIAAAGGTSFSLGLKDDGSIVAWGWNNVGQCDVPMPNENYVAVAAGHAHGLGLKDDGTIVCWGLNNVGQCDVPAPNSDFIALDGGGGGITSHSLGLKADGSIIAWGGNTSGECDVPSPNTGFVAVSAGGHHSLGLKDDGSIVAWGANGSGQCDVPAPNTGFIAVAAGASFSLGLKDDGSIVAWGDNSSGQCDVPGPNTGFVAVAAGDSHGLGVKSYGPIVAWGYNYSGQCDVPAPNDGFASAAAGSNCSLGLR